MGPISSVLDLFSGTSRVGHAFKAAGYRVHANDHNAYAAELARCYVVADRDDVQRQAAALVDEFNRLPGRDGYFTKTFCLDSRFFQPKNGARIDAIREAIEAKELPTDLRAVMLTSLMEAANRVDSSVGLQMAYLKSWSARSHQDLELRVPDVLPRAAHGKGSASMLDAIEAASQDVDLAYLDPPYNQHSYLGNYHVWESLVRWDKPEVYGVACKRVDVRERKSVYNSRPKFIESIQALLSAIRAPKIVLSFNNEGYASREQIEQILRGLWGGNVVVSVFAHDFRRHIGSSIGVFNPSGDKVGTVSHTTNIEYIYTAGRIFTPC